MNNYPFSTYYSKSSLIPHYALHEHINFIVIFNQIIIHSQKDTTENISQGNAHLPSIPEKVIHIEEVSRVDIALIFLLQMHLIFHCYCMWMSWTFKEFV